MVLQILLSPAAFYIVCAQFILERILKTPRGSVQRIMRCQLADADGIDFFALAARGEGQRGCERQHKCQHGCKYGFAVLHN